jgi:hypothetical protein
MSGGQKEPSGRRRQPPPSQGAARDVVTAAEHSRFSASSGEIAFCGAAVWAEIHSSNMKIGFTTVLAAPYTL